MLTVLTVTEAREKILSYISEAGLGTETLLLNAALGRVLSDAVVAGSDLPPFLRSTMDGYAVMAKDTYGASEALPSLLSVTGEVMMGKEPPGHLNPGQAMKISTGGMLPPGSDAVVMVEYTELLDHETVAVQRPVAPGENTIARGEDVRAGDVLLPAGHRLRPQDIGALAAIGQSTVMVTGIPRVAILSTGDELVAPDKEIGPGQIRDVNTYLLSALVQQAGALPVPLGIIPDRADALLEALDKTREYDCVLLSGGSSAGTRDLTAETIDKLGKPGVIFHGVSMRPGKPLIFGMVDGRPYFGLSGNPTSAMVGFLLFVKPLLYKMQGYEEKTVTLYARPDVNLSSASGREDYFRATLYNRDGELWATPLLGQANLISTVLRGNALLRIPQNCEGVEAGEPVEAILI